MTLFAYLLLAATALPWASASCSHRTSHFRRDAAKFSYDDGAFTGPKFWHTLDAANYMCNNGTMQAPCVLHHKKTHTIPARDLKIHIPKARHALFENLGTTVEVEVEGSLKVDGLEYSLKQFHFHTPSEHRIDDLWYAMEMHMVFQTESKNTAVVAFLLDAVPSVHQPLIDTLARYVGRISKKDSHTKVPNLNVAAFIKKSFSHNSHFFSLTQSLTTPPCTEGVQWYISTKPIPIAIHSLKQFRKIIKFNSRPI